MVFLNDFLMPNLILPPLYLVTDRHQVGEANFLNILEKLIPCGGFMLQLREKDLSVRALLQLATIISKWTKSFRVPFLINDRVDVVMATQADGVHLRESSLPVQKARKCLGPNRLIGVSVHSVKDAVAREQEGADFVVLGPIYDTSSKAYGSPLGLSILQEATQKCRIPIFAIGGIQPSCVEEIQKTGAYGVAVISSIFRSTSSAETVKYFTAKLGVPEAP